MNLSAVQPEAMSRAAPSKGLVPPLFQSGSNSLGYARYWGEMRLAVPTR